jgi:glycosyltransferase involved in cell wall biosynthesis
MSILPAKLSGAYFVFDMKSSLAEMYRLSGKIKKGSFYYNALSFLEGLCVRLSDTVIVETEDHRLLLERKLAGRSRRPLVSVLPCCVEVERFRAQEGRRDMDRPTDAITMVYMGSLSGWYMIPEMLDFFKAVKERFKKASLLFLTYDKEGRLARLVKEKGVEGVSVRKADYHEVPAILSSATFGMLFKWPNERLDSFPIKVGEYLASGLPVIINAGMGDVEALIAGHGLGIVVRSLTREGYEKACSEMEPLIRDMGNARKRCACAAADRLSSSFALAQYETVYNNIKR